MNISLMERARTHRLAFIMLVIGTLFTASFALADIVSGSFSTNQSNDVQITQLSINKPMGVTMGDLELANIAVNGGSPAVVTPPSGWTQILRTDNDTNVSVISYYRIASASESANYTWSISPQTSAEGGITRYTGVDTSNPIDTFSGNVGFGNTATTSSITTTSPNEEIVTLYVVDVGKSTHANNYFTTPSGMTEKYDVSNIPFGPSTASDDNIQVLSGVTVSKSATISGNKARNWAAQVIALRMFSPRTVSTLIVAGGGGGGSSNTTSGIYAGGGGAGGLLFNTSLPISVGTYAVIVGAGGAGGPSTGNTAGSNGGDSTFSTLIAIGGGGGGPVSTNGSSGGSGGGAGQTATGGSGVSGQGNNGGDGSGGGAGGGGGAGAIGGFGSGTNAGNGGDGISNSTSGFTVTYAGGGGGGGLSSAGSGGSGGGGSGGVSAAGADGIANTGGGGGGAATVFGSYAGGNGGSGVVIISYPTGSMTATGGTITTSGGNTIHTFTSSGTFTVTSI